MSKTINLDDVTSLDIEEITKVDLYSQIKHRVEKENNMEAQREFWKSHQKSMDMQKWYWLGVVILGIAALYFK